MDVMRRSLLSATTLAAAVCAAVLLAACGSQTKTVSVAATPSVSQTTATQTTPTTSTAKTTPTSTTPAPTSTAGGAAAPSTTRSAPEPAFTQHEASAEGVSAAAALVRASGFTPNDTSEYHQGQTLRVLIGTRTGSGDGYGQRAFFYVGGRYIGTDAKEPSATVKVLSQSDTTITLAYPLYRPNDPLSTPSGGQATVRFELNNGKLTPVGAIPPASSKTGLSRY
jgi:hypothetical protein